MKKTCRNCGKDKKLSKFNKNFTYSDNLDGRCKKCAIKSGKKWIKTKDGLLSALYRGHKTSSITRNHRQPEYSKAELFDWCNSQTKFHELYSEWVNSNYEKRLRPSIDRKEDAIHYCFSNIQLMTWGENNDKPRTANYKSVYQYTKSGEFIRSYSSMVEAQEITNVKASNISQVCHGHRATAGGFVWTLNEKANSVNSSIK